MVFFRLFRACCLTILALCHVCLAMLTCIPAACRSRQVCGDEAAVVMPAGSKVLCCAPKPGCGPYRYMEAARTLYDDTHSVDSMSTNVAQGDPAAAPYTVELVKQLLGKKPMFGICMGHQVSACILHNKHVTCSRTCHAYSFSAGWQERLS